MSSPSIWAAPPPTSASSSMAQCSKWPEGQIAGQDIGTPMLRVRTFGAGGGTVAEVGKDGLLKVGPRSSGSAPGPACYSRGGTEATVTDANLLLGALSGETLLAGTLRLDEAAGALGTRAHRFLARYGRAADASGIMRIVNTHMAVDLRLALQEQGQDPRTFALVAFGGAGPLHASTLARSVGIPAVLVPPYPGLNCAIGMLQTSVRHSYLRSEIGSLRRIRSSASTSYSPRSRRRPCAKREKKVLPRAR